MRTARRLLVAAFCALAGLVPAEARRVALVIGNADYKAGPLTNPVRDAEAVAAAFEKQLGFDKVILRKNLAFDGFRAALQELAREAAGAELGVVYFAGHGLEVNGRNYLIPVDARLAQPGDLGLEAIALDLVLEQLAGARRLKLVILDACRDNPFPAARRGGRGLKAVEPEDNTLVVYAAKGGTTADDGGGRGHSPFTAALLKHIATPGLEINFVFRRVRDDVVAATKSVQTPHTYGTLGGAELYLKPLALVPPVGLPLAPKPDAAAQAWAAARDSTSIAVLEAFRAQYGAANAFYDRLAAARIEELRKQQVALLKAEEDKKRDPALSVKPGSGQSFRDRTKDGQACPDCPEMVVVPPGSFTMGSSRSEIAALKKEYASDWYDSEGPQRRVTIARPFVVGRFEVTFAEWDACLMEGGCTHRPEDQGWGRGRRPVIDVSWNHITQQYLPWLSRKTGKTYRLLTEAEWEYVARAGTTTPFWWGSSISPSQANYNGNYTYLGGPKGEYRQKTLPVDSFASNPWGLYNVHGNISEWVQDCWNGSYNGAPTDGSARTTGDCDRRVVRGGAWGIYPWYLRSAGRDWGTSVYRSNVQGFRLARTLSLV
jgi:formylglycine-generating enzyme required for sulfatase activity